MASSHVDTSGDPTLVAPDHLCASCGAPLAADQRYCLNCGRSLARRDDLLSALGTPPPGVTTTTTTTAADLPLGGPPTGPASLTAWGAGALAGLLLLAGVAGAVIAGDDPQPAPQVRVAAAPQPNVNVTVPAASGAATAPAEFVSDWSGDDGWTIALQTLPKDGTDPAAVAAAKTAAQGDGAEDVGALDSDEFPSLDAGEYVVYSGVFETKKAATKELKALRKDFPDAKVVEVSADAGGGAKPKVEKDAEEQSDSALKELQDSKGDDFVKKSKKLPDKVGTEGSAPKTDNKKPGGGGDGGTVLE